MSTKNLIIQVYSKCNSNLYFYNQTSQISTLPLEYVTGYNFLCSNTLETSFYQKYILRFTYRKGLWKSHSPFFPHFSYQTSAIFKRYFQYTLLTHNLVHNLLQNLYRKFQSNLQPNLCQDQPHEISIIQFSHNRIRCAWTTSYIQYIALTTNRCARGSTE